MNNNNEQDKSEAPADEVMEPIPFSTDGIPAHLEILKAPDLLPEHTAPIAEASADWSEVEDFVLGEEASLIKLNSVRQLRGAALRLLKQATREVLLVTPDLEEARFNNEAFVSAISDFVRTSRYAVCRILVGNPDDAVRDHHRLVPLLRRLSSRIEIRRLHEDDRSETEAWMVVDNIALLRCTDRQPWQGGLSPRNAPDARRCRDQFHFWWERAALIPDFREFRA
jgi:hypothetical protein